MNAFGRFQVIARRGDLIFIRPLVPESSPGAGRGLLFPAA